MARITDGARPAELTSAWEAQYGPECHFEVGDAAFGSATAVAAPLAAQEAEDAAVALVLEVAPHTVFGFGGSTPHTVFGFGGSRRFRRTCRRLTR